ncbi:hypothetical protein SLEP1_g40710 [Rubroshorea leprosula]|uniref:Amino acid permease/ SLC12A domain-containing protein n=1 Tax=Rubroshorea leprosula TaxID=152421 RepID=A0AAV5L556_9ROSI|nr:hypothetical protein SLEP1_g40710 [Rubroshorea leprosula]
MRSHHVRFIFVSWLLLALISWSSARGLQRWGQEPVHEPVWSFAKCFDIIPHAPEGLLWKKIMFQASIYPTFTSCSTAYFHPKFFAHRMAKLVSSAVLFFAYLGFDSVSTMAEETKNPARDIPIGLVGSMTITTAAYCLLAITLCLMQPYQQIDKDAPFSAAFQAVGMNWAKYIVAAGALKGMTTILLVGAVGQARYLTHIARTHMANLFIAMEADGNQGTKWLNLICVFQNSSYPIFQNLNKKISTLNSRFKSIDTYRLLFSLFQPNR